MTRSFRQSEKVSEFGIRRAKRDEASERKIFEETDGRIRNFLASREFFDTQAVHGQLASVRNGIFDISEHHPTVVVEPVPSDRPHECAAETVINGKQTAVIVRYRIYDRRTGIDTVMLAEESV